MKILVVAAHPDDEILGIGGAYPRKDGKRLIIWRAEVKE